MSRTADEEELFAKKPIGRAVLSMILPTIISQIIIVIYNLADTLYVGLTENANAVAAISLCLPVFSLLSALSNLFGIGGAAAAARALGIKNEQMAGRVLRLSLVGAFVIAVCYAIFMAVCRKPLLLLIGGDMGTIDYAENYVFWTIIVGGIPTVVSPVCGHLIRSMGYPRQASMGMILGALLNIGLDPLFMFVLLPPGNEVTGTAIATALSNSIALVYYVVSFRINKVLGDRPKPESGTGKILVEIVRGGLPSFCMIALAMLSNCFLNSMISSLGSEAVAGLGIVRKIDQLAYAVNQGITQGILPLAAYCYASGRRRRMWSAVGICTAVSEMVSVTSMIVSLLFARQLVSVFIREPVTVSFGSEFLRVLCMAIPIYSLTFLIIAVFQAMGCGEQPFILSILHKGSLDILLQFLLRKLVGTENILWATLISETVALVTGIWMLVRFLKKSSSKLTADI